jgi:photosystem II stability/assembly factor-like uncharacterized protein
MFDRNFDSRARGRWRAPRGLVAACLLLVSAAALGQTRQGTWWRLPVWGADVRDFAVDPFQPGRVYLGTARGNFYGSEDNGETWRALRPGRPFPGFVVASLVADPDVPDRLWAGLAGQNGGAIFARSDNRGADWTILTQWTRSVAARGVALSPKLPDGTRRIAIGGDDGVRLSSDGGSTWEVSGEDVPGLWRVESVAFDPQDPRVLYAGTWRLGFRTKDGGKTWKKIDEGMVLDSTIYSWDFSENGSAKEIWVSTCGWVYRTQNGGDTWTRFKEGFTNRRSHSVRADPKRPGTFYAATVGGLHRSQDGGERWARVTRESMVVTALELDPRSGRLLIGTEGEGVFWSDDGGASFGQGSVGLAEGRIPDVVPDPDDPARVFFYRAYAGEETGVWEAREKRVRRVSRGLLPAEASLASLKDGLDRVVLLLASANGVLVSDDGGMLWKPPASPPPGAPIALFSTPFPEPILVTGEGAFTTRNGFQYTRIAGSPTGIQSAALLVDRAGEAVLELRLSGGVQRWSRGSWTSPRAPKAAKEPTLKGGIFRDEPEEEPPGTFRSLYESGGTLVWREAGRRLTVASPGPGLAFSSAVTAPGGRLYVGTTGDGLYFFEPAGAEPAGTAGGP